MVAAMVWSVLLLSGQFEEEVNAPAASGMTPPLGLVFPVAQQGERVVISEPVLINPSTVLKKGTVARVMFVLPRPTDQDVKMATLAQEHNPAYSRQRNETILKKSEELTPLQRAAYDRGVKTIWETTSAFRAGLEHLDPFNSRFVFEKEDGSLGIEMVDLPDGMLWCERDGGVVVLSIADDSPLIAQGVSAGVRFKEIAGSPAPTELVAFRDFYFAKRAESKSGSGRFTFRVVAQNGAQEREVVLQLPRSLKGDFWSQYDSIQQEAE